MVFPSPRIWNDYKAYMERKYHGKIEKIDFRNKERFGWSDHWETVTINGKEHDSQVYMKMFYEHTFLREACYVCPYKNLQRISDISIADAWGVETANRNSMIIGEFHLFLLIHKKEKNGF